MEVIVAKSTLTQLSIPGWLLEQLLKYGEDHHLENGSDELKTATVALHALKQYMRSYSREDVQSYIAETGCCYDDLHCIGIDRVVSDRRR